MTSYPQKPVFKPPPSAFTAEIERLRASLAREQRRADHLARELQRLQRRVQRQDVSTQTNTNDVEEEMVEYQHEFLADQAMRLMARRKRHDDAVAESKRPRTPGLVTSASRPSHPEAPKASAKPSCSKGAYVS